MHNKAPTRINVHFSPINIRIQTVTFHINLCRMHNCLIVMRTELKQQSSREISTFGHDTNVIRTVSYK
jgi:hypothetical protein